MHRVKVAGIDAACSVLHREPSAPGCECGAPVHDGPHDAAIRTELGNPDGPTVGNTVAFIDGLREALKSEDDASKRRAGKLRVFVFEGVAYQVDARARFASVVAPQYDDAAAMGAGRVTVKIDGRSAVLWKHIFEPDLYQAERLSLESEWFELTIRKAAHDYLDTWLDLERAFFDDQNSREYSLVAAACIGFLSVQRCFYLRDIVAGMTGPYLSRVKADLEARLRGEPGKVALP